MKNELIEELRRTNLQILSEFHGYMKGVIHNKHGKSKKFQFAMLEKNYEQAVNLIWVFSDTLYDKYKRGEPLYP